MNEESSDDKVSFNDMECYDDGSPTRDSIQRFINTLPVSERGQLLDEEKRPTRQAQERLKSAIFAKAYGSKDLIKMYSQALDPEAKTIIDGLSKASIAMIKLSTVSKDYDIRDIISSAVNKILSIKKKGGSISDAVGQTDLFDSANPDNKYSDEEVRNLSKIFAENYRSSNAIANSLRKLAESLKREAEREPDLFGEGGLPRSVVIDKIVNSDKNGY